MAKEEAAMMAGTSGGVGSASGGKGRASFKGASECLLEIVRRCAQHDSSRFFSDPVTEEVAPNYFTIIKKPMDFFTIRKKIDERKYETWRQFVDDLELICSNAMTYNQKRSRVHKAAGHLQRCLRKVLRENELEGRRSILLWHPEATNTNQTVVTDVTLEGAYNPEVCEEAWRDEQAQQARAAERNNLAIKKAEERCMSAFIRSTCAAQALNSPLTEDMIKDAEGAPKQKQQVAQVERSDLVECWSSFSDTEDEVAEGKKRGSAPRGGVQRPAIVQVESLPATSRAREASATMQVEAASPSKGGEGSAASDAAFRKVWREDKSRKEIMWRCRWLERRIKMLEADERTYKKKLGAMGKGIQATGEEARNPVVGAPGTSGEGSERGSQGSSKFSAIAGSQRKTKRRRVGKRNGEFSLAKAFPGWFGVFSHLGPSEALKDSTVVALPTPMEEDKKGDSDVTENVLVELMEEALLMHKQVHALHAQISYARQNINKQGKIIHARSTMPPIIDPQIFKTRIGARLLAFEHEQSVNQNAPNGEGLCLSPGAGGYLSPGFDVDNLVSPGGTSKVPSPLKVEFINTPGVRDISGTDAEASAKDEKAACAKQGGKGAKDAKESDEESEDTSDELYERLHRPLETAERARFVAPLAPNAPGQQVGVSSRMNRNESGPLKQIPSAAEHESKGRKNRSTKAMMS